MHHFLLAPTPPTPPTPASAPATAATPCAPATPCSTPATPSPSFATPSPPPATTLPFAHTTRPTSRLCKPLSLFRPARPKLFPALRLPLGRMPLGTPLRLELPSRTIQVHNVLRTLPHDSVGQLCRGAPLLLPHLQRLGTGTRHAPLVGLFPLEPDVKLAHGRRRDTCLAAGGLDLW